MTLLDAGPGPGPRPGVKARAWPAVRAWAERGVADLRDRLDDEPRPTTTRAYVTSTAITIVGTLLIAFCLCLGPLGYLQHARSQQLGQAKLRSDLALAVAPVGQGGNDHRLLAPGTPVALLQIPAIKLREVVFEGTTSAVLTKGPGHSRDTPLPGQAGTSLLLGRQAGYGGPFARLDELHPGDRITVTTGQGLNSFLVTGIRHAGDELPTAASGTSRLTLATGSGVAYLPSGVIYVDAKATSEVRPAAARRLLKADLSTAEQPMGSDASAWLAILLWSQLLCAAGVVFGIARQRWGLWPTWVVGLPVFIAISIALADNATLLLPNLV